MSVAIDTKALPNAVTVGLEPLSCCRTEIMRLAQKHGEEFTYHRAVKGPVDPNWEMFLSLESAGNLKLATMRVDGVLAGYFVIAKAGTLAHYQTVTRCMDDTFYIAPEYRGGWSSYRFLKFAIAEMEKTGAKILTVSNKVKSDYGAVWRRLGFEPEEIMYSKVNLRAT